MSGEPFRRVSKASLDDLQKLLNKLIENTGKKTIIKFGDQEMNAKWAAVTLKNKSCRKKPKLSSKATGVKIKLARIFKSVTKSQILKNLCQCLTARANITCYVAWATGQRDLPTMPDCKGQRNMLRRVGNRAARQKTRQIYGVSALAYLA